MDESLIYTPFAIIYDRFLSRITSDMYMELTELDTMYLLQELLIDAMPQFEFPRFDITNYELGYMDSLGDYSGVESDNVELPATGWVGGTFYCQLTAEEINILSIYMVVEWLGQQLASTENTRLLYGGSNFKFSSQANHMAKLNTIVKETRSNGFHLQRLYKRRLKVDGVYKSTIGSIMGRDS